MQTHEIERQILGSLLIAPTLRRDAYRRIGKHEMSCEKHRIIYQRLPFCADALELLDDLTKSGEIEAAGGAVYLAGLIGDSTFPAAIDDQITALLEAV